MYSRHKCVQPLIPAVAPQVQQVEVNTEVKNENVAKVETQGRPIVSPMVGTFYKAPGVGEKPFVELGDSVAVGQVVCIVEAMKLMNEIESEVSGKVTKICVEDGPRPAAGGRHNNQRHTAAGRRHTGAFCRRSPAHRF